MKIKYIIPVVCASLFSSCVNDLDVQPLDSTVVTPSIAYKDEASYFKGLAKIYSVLAISGQDGVGSSDILGLDPGNCQFFRSWWNLQEVPTDECVNGWGNDAWAKELNQSIWTDAQNESIEGAYQRSMYIVALANEYITQVDANNPADNIKKYREEARFMRALAYYYLMDQFGNPPFITESNYSASPSQIGRVELYKWLESELMDLTELLPETNDLGRASKYAAYALLSRMYLNAEVYIGEAKYTESIAASKEVIAGGYTLCPTYQNLFLADNDKNGAQSETIFSILYDGTSAQTYGGSTYLIQSSRSGGENDVNESGLTAGGWGGNRAASNLVKKFEFEDNNNPTAATIKDKRGVFFDKNRTIVVEDWATFATNGWAVYKFKNITTAGAPGSNGTFCDMDIILFRLGEIYLNYAEAVVRGGQGGDVATAVGYINALRARGYEGTVGNITASDLTTDFILDERARELHWEGVRRTDLIRYGLFTSGSYTWDWKGGIVSGVAIDNYKNLYPIPTTDLSVNPSLQQNEGY